MNFYGQTLNIYLLFKKFNIIDGKNKKKRFITVGAIFHM
jgi:hypothetical protein